MIPWFPEVTPACSCPTLRTTDTIWSVILLVENLTQGPINLEGWHKDEFDDNHRGCKKTLLETITPPNTVTFAPHDNIALEWINQTYIISASAPLDHEFPRVQLSHGGTIGK